MKRHTRRMLPLIAGMILAALFFAGCASAATPLETGVFPRSETLYYNGIQWGAPTNWNPFSAAPCNFVMFNNQPTARMIIYEPLFMYNQLDGKLYSLLGTEYSWNEQVLTVKLNPDAHWNDGTPFTAADVVNTFELGKRYALNISSNWTYLDSVEALDDHTVAFRGKADNFNALQMEYALQAVFMVPKHIWDEYEKEANYNGAALMQIVNNDPVATGPYKVYLSDDTKVAMVRDDNYWGQAASMFGKLPAPKYIVHNIFKDNAGGDAALRAGQVDVSQQFTSQIWRMWEDSGLPIETYIPDAPYYIPGTIPTIIFNMEKPGLDDPAVRKAIAMSLNYDMIGQNAMSGYTAPMVPSLMLPTAPDQALIDTEALRPYQWSNADVEAANALLDQAGWLPGADGIREKNGVKLSYRAECPAGWSDWNATLEVVSQNTKAIGMDIQTYFPEQSVCINDRETGNFDIIMHMYAQVSIASPWLRAYQIMYSDVPEMGVPAYSNFGRYENERADELLNLIPSETDPIKLKEYWTELNIIFLQDVPAVGLMYRPAFFHQVNTSVWTGFPRLGDGKNIPPTCLLNGYGLKGLYEITAK